MRIRKASSRACDLSGSRVYITTMLTGSFTDSPRRKKTRGERGWKG